MRLFLFFVLCLWPWTPACRVQQQGRVVDAITGAGIPGADVTFGERVIQTGADGRFSVGVSAPIIQARAPGYRAVSLDAAKFLASSATLPLTPFRPKALYLSGYGIGSQSIRGAALKLIHDAKLNALVIDVKSDRGFIAYPSGSALARAVGAQQIITIPDLPALLRSLHQAGIYVIARVVTFKDNRLATARPDLAVRLQNGKLFREQYGIAWTDPTIKEAAEYNIAVAVEVVRAGFDEIQFDYLRFPDAPKAIAFAKSTTQASRLVY